MITDLGVLEPDPETERARAHRRSTPGVDVDAGPRGDRLGPRRARRPRRPPNRRQRDELDSAAGAARPVSAAYVLDAVRAPFGRYGGGLAKVRPDDLGGPRRAERCSIARPNSTPSAIDEVMFGDANAGRRGQPQRRADGVAAERPADERPRRHDQPAVRLEPRRGDAGQPGDRDRRRVDRARRRRRVDEPRAMDPAQARARVPARQRDSCTRARSGGGWSTRRCPSSGRSRSARAPRSSPTIYKISREAQDAFALRSHQHAHARVGQRLLRRVGGAGAGHRARARREHPSRHLAREAREAQAGVRQGRHGDRRQLISAQRRRERGADRATRRAPRPPAANRSRGSSRAAAAAVDPDVFGIAPVKAANIALERAGITLGGRRSCRAQRGVRLAVPGRHRANGRSSTPTR